MRFFADLCFRETPALSTSSICNTYLPASACPCMFCVREGQANVRASSRLFCLEHSGKRQRRAWRSGSRAAPATFMSQSRNCEKTSSAWREERAGGGSGPVLMLSNFQGRWILASADGPMKSLT